MSEERVFSQEDAIYINAKLCPAPVQARVLTLEEALDWNREIVWLQMRWWKTAIWVQYALEQSPWLRFRKDGMEISVRADQYGKSWRCFSNCFVIEDFIPWEDGGGRWNVEDDPEEEP